MAPAIPGPARQTPWRIHAVLPRSRANGPGLRYVIWTQGCTLGCPGCFNPETHPISIPNEPELSGAAAATAEALADEVAAEALRAVGESLDGVSLTGGEPLEQPEAVAAFCDRLKEQRGDLGIVILTGFTRREIEADPPRLAAVANADMVIAGRYNAKLRIARGLRGSSNKQYWSRSARYCSEDFADVPEVELIIGPDGAVTVTGTPLDVAG
jgi:anaerobic ribonucleoside-triphosphate reductase activating protein